MNYLLQQNQMTSSLSTNQGIEGIQKIEKLQGIEDYTHCDRSFDIQMQSVCGV